jgi:hypothetical protein
MAAFRALLLLEECAICAALFSWLRPQPAQYVVVPAYAPAYAPVAVAAVGNRRVRLAEAPAQERLPNPGRQLAL